jgi:hypothetical protein
MCGITCRLALRKGVSLIFKTFESFVHGSAPSLSQSFPHQFGKKNLDTPIKTKQYTEFGFKVVFLVKTAR